MPEYARPSTPASDRETERFFKDAMELLVGDPLYAPFLLEICRADERYRPYRTFRQLVNFYPDGRLRPDECRELSGQEAERRRGAWLRKLISMLEEFIRAGSLPRVSLTRDEILSMWDMTGNCWTSTFHSWMPREIRDRGADAILVYLQSAIEWVLQHRA